MNHSLKASRWKRDCWKT